MRKLYFAFISIWLLTLTAFAQGPSRVAVMAYTNGNLITPTNFFASNLLAGANVSISIGASGKVTIATIATNVVSTNFAAIFVTNFVEGTNYTWYFATNVPRGIVTFEWLTNLLSTVGTNVAMLTNGNQFQGVPLSIKADYKTTNANIYSNPTDSSTNILLHVVDIGTRGAPIFQIVDDNSGNILFEVDNSAVLNANGSGVTNINGANIQPTTINSNQINAALDAVYRAGSLAVTLNSVTGVVQSYVGNNATNVDVAASTFHTNWANAVSNLTVSLILTNSTNIIYVSPRGNDATWVRGRQGKPCATLSNAVFWSRAGDTIVMEPGWYTNYSAFHARVHSNAPVLLTNKTDLTILADGAIMYWPTGMVTGLLFYQSSNITVRGLSLVNHRTNVWPLPKVATNDYVSTGGFGQAEVIDSVDIRFWDCRFIGSFDHGILTDSTRPGDYPYKSTFAATNCEIRSCTALDCGQWDAGGWWDGAGFVVSHGWRVTGNYIHGASVGVEYYPLEDGQHRPGAVIVGNISVDTVIGYAVKYGRPIVSGNQSFWTGTHGLTNYMGLGSMGIRCDVTDGGLISDNLFQGNVFGVFLVSCTNLTIADNQIIGGARALHMDSASRLKVAGNASRDTWQYGFMLATGKLLDSEFSHNTWENCGTNNAPYDINYFGDSTTVSNVTFTGETIRGDFPMPRSITLGTAVTSTNIILQDNLFPAPPAFPVPSLLHERSTNRVKMLLSATPGQVWTATNVNGFGTWSNVAPASVSSNGTLVVSPRTTNLNFIAGNANTDVLVSNNPAGQANIIITASAGTGDAGGTNARAMGLSSLTNLGQLSSFAFTNVPLGGTNINVRNADGTNFFDTTGQLNNWALFGTNVLTNVVYGATNDAFAYARSTTNNLRLTNLVDVAPKGMVGLANGQVLKYNGTWWTNDTDSTGDTVGTNFYNAEVSNSVRSLNGFFTNLTVYSDFAVSNLSAVSFTLSNISPGLAYFSTADTNLASLPTGAVGKILMATNGSDQYAWVDMPGGSTSTNYIAFTNSIWVAFAGNLGIKSNLNVGGNSTVDGTNTVNQLEVTTATVSNALYVGTTYVDKVTLSNVSAGVAYFDASAYLTNIGNPSGTKMLTYSNSALAWHDVPSGGSGEANVNGEVSVTNATMVGLVYGKAGVTNLLRSLTAGPGMVLTNYGTNVVISSTGLISTNLQNFSFTNAIGTNLTLNGSINADTATVTNALHFISAAAPDWTIRQMGSYLVVSNDTDLNAFHFMSDGIARRNGTDVYTPTNYWTGTMVTNGTTGVLSNSPNLVGATAWGSSGGSNYTRTDANGWWQTNGAYGFSRIQQGKVDLYSGVSNTSPPMVTLHGSNGLGALAFTMPVGWGTSNVLQFTVTNPAAGQLMKFLTVSGNTVTVTNVDPSTATAIVGSGTVTVSSNEGTYTITGSSNLPALSVGDMTLTNNVLYLRGLTNIDSGAFTNLVVNFNLSRITVSMTNGCTMTNFAGLEADQGTGTKYLDMLLVGRTNAMPQITLPTFGGNSYGIHLWTNAAQPICTLITNGTRVRYTWAAEGTNVSLVSSIWF